MKILVLTTTFPRWKGDTTPAFVYELSKRLKKDGHEIVVLAPHHEGAKRFEIMDELKIYRFPYFWPTRYQKLTYEGGILPNLKRSNLAKLEVPLLFLAELYYTCEIIKKEKIDVIYSHWIIPNGLVGGICSSIFSIKHILTEHAAGLVALEKIPLRHNISKYIVENSDGITFVSTYVHRRFLNLVGPDISDTIRDKSEIIPMGVDSNAFKRSADKNYLKQKYDIKSKNVLLFIGRLVEKKGLLYLINAMPGILVENSDIELIICGNGPLKKECEELIKKMKLNESIQFVGHVTDMEKVEYFSLSDMLIVPSIVTSSGDTEGLPVVIMEGLAAGKPIIASDVGGVRDVIKDGVNGFIVEQKNSDQIVEKVLELTNNEELKIRFSDIALETVKTYDWAIIGENYEKFIKKCVIDSAYSNKLAQKGDEL